MRKAVEEEKAKQAKREAKRAAKLKKEQEEKERQKREAVEAAKDPMAGYETISEDESDNEQPALLRILTRHSHHLSREALQDSDDSFDEESDEEDSFLRQQIMKDFLRKKQKEGSRGFTVKKVYRESIDMSPSWTINF